MSIAICTIWSTARARSVGVSRSRSGRRLLQQALERLLQAHHRATHTMPRSWASEPLAIAQPSFSVPTRFAARHPDVVEEHLVQVGVLGVDDLGQRPHGDPGVSIGTSTIEMPLCFGASGSVRQNRKQKSA